MFDIFRYIFCWDWFRCEKFFDEDFDGGTEEQMFFLYLVEERDTRQCLGSTQCRVGLPSCECVRKIKCTCVKSHALRFVNRDSIGELEWELFVTSQDIFCDFSFAGDKDFFVCSGL